MSKVKDVPTETLAAMAQKTYAETDARGRRIVVSQLNALQYYNLIKAMGSAAENAAALDFAMIAATVRSIDTVKFAVPTSERDVQFIIQQLDFDGIAAAGTALKNLGMTAADDSKAEVAAAKN